MATLVLIETEDCTLTRIETGGEHFRPTHRCTFGERVSIPPALIEDFRLMPPPEFALDPPPRPTNSPCGAGTIQRAA